MNGHPQFGPLLTESGVTFRLWAPGARQVSLVLDTAVDMRKRDGWFALHVPEARAGTRYRFKIDGELEIPDPASHFQPQDVHGASEVIDHRFGWTANGWSGLPWEQSIFLEAHVGTFTPQGTFRAMIERLDHLAETGITALELMPAWFSYFLEELKSADQKNVVALVPAKRPMPPAAVREPAFVAPS